LAATGRFVVVVVVVYAIMVTLEWTLTGTFIIGSRDVPVGLKWLFCLDNLHVPCFVKRSYLLCDLN
jgi:hypothetical protein